MTRPKHDSGPGAVHRWIAQLLVAIALVAGASGCHKQEAHVTPPPSAPAPSPPPKPVPEPHPAEPAKVRGTVCVDPGHPSENGNGCTGHSGATETEVNWAVAQLLRDDLAEAGLTVLMTKSKLEQRVTNRERARIANAAEADLLVRLHCDSGTASGFAVYYPDRQGRAHGVVGPSDRVITESREAAAAMRLALSKALQDILPDRGTKGDAETAVGARQGALTGSVFSTVPVITLEMCVLTNRDDEAVILSQSGQTRVANAIADGVVAALAALRDPRTSDEPDRTGQHQAQALPKRDP